MCKGGRRGWGTARKSVLEQSDLFGAVVVQQISNLIQHRLISSRSRDSIDNRREITVSPEALAGGGDDRKIQIRQNFIRYIAAGNIKNIRDFWVTVKVHQRIRPLRARAGKAGTVV